MQQPEDVVHLYKEFGGQPESYRELARTRDATQARERWPLISALGDLSATAAAGVPPVQANEDPVRLERAWHAALQPVPPVARAEPAIESVEPRGPLPEPVPAVSLARSTPVSHLPAPPAPMAGLVSAPAPVAPAPVPASPPAPASGTSARLQSLSPLSRLARPPAEAAPGAQPAGLQQVFARLLGKQGHS